jgi:KDO2-lipid IV(A) lauroyltransferase
MLAARDGPWSRRRRMKNDALFWLATAALRAGLALPKALLPSAGALLGQLSYLTLGRARRIALRNLERVYPSLAPAERRAMVARTFRCLGQNLTNTLALLDAREPEERTLSLPAESANALAAALAEGRGVVYATAHLGPWERMASLLAHRGFPITTLARESYDPRFHELLYDPLRARRGVTAIYRGSPGAPAAIVRALKKGRVLGFLMDLPGRVPTIPVTLLGQPSRAPVGPARLALRLGVPVVVGCPAPGKNGSTEIHIARLSTAGLVAGETGEAALTQQIADALSDHIRAWPAAWPWMHPSFDAPLL